MDTHGILAARWAVAIDGGTMTDSAGRDRIRMSVAEARGLGEAAMRGAGYDGDEARILTDHVLDAALSGYEYSGLPKLLNVVDHPDFNLPRRPIAVLRETGATALLDGGNNTGMVAPIAPRKRRSHARRQAASRSFASPTPG